MAMTKLRRTPARMLIADWGDGAIIGDYGVSQPAPTTSAWGSKRTRSGDSLNSPRTTRS